MIKCSRCGQQTELYVEGVPLCLKCDEAEANRKIEMYLQKKRAEREKSKDTG